MNEWRRGCDKCPQVEVTRKVSWMNQYLSGLSRWNSRYQTWSNFALWVESQNSWVMFTRSFSFIMLMFGKWMCFFVTSWSKVHGDILQRVSCHFNGNGYSPLMLKHSGPGAMSTPSYTLSEHSLIPCIQYGSWETTQEAVVKSQTVIMRPRSHSQATSFKKSSLLSLPSWAEFVQWGRKKLSSSLQVFCLFVFWLV